METLNLNSLRGEELVLAIHGKDFYKPRIVQGPDKHGNYVAHEGCDRCECGSKYWENDTCIDCGTNVTAHLFFNHSVNGYEGFEGFFCFSTIQ